MDFINEPVFLTGIISTFTSIITVLVIKPIIDKKLLIFQLEKEHEYSQRKKIKENLSTYKVHIINTGESLKHRLRGTLSHKHEDWKLLSEDKQNEYHFKSTIYRFLAFLGWIKILEQKMIFLDTTVSSKNDLIFIKYIQLFPQIFCGSHLFSSSKVETVPQDRFFRDEFDQICSILIKDDKIISYQEFKDDYKSYKKGIKKLINFFEDISPIEKTRYRWEVLSLFLWSVVAFLNTFGYDFQQARDKGLISYFNQPFDNRKKSLFKGYEHILITNKLNNQKEIKRVLKLIIRYDSI